MHSSHVDAAMVILHNVGETAALQMLEDCMKIISERESTSHELLVQRDCELEEVKHKQIQQERLLAHISQGK